MAKKKDAVKKTEIKTEAIENDIPQGEGTCLGSGEYPENAQPLPKINPEDETIYVKGSFVSIISPDELKDDLEIITKEEYDSLVNWRSTVTVGEYEDLNKKLETVYTELEQTSNNFEAAKNQNLDFAEKIKELETKEENQDNSAFIQFLDELDAAMDHYAGRRTERLRREFVTDIKELIAKTKEGLK
jgi:hypothetical protein